MLFVDNLNGHDASLNLALEEYVLRNARTDEDLLLFYINAPSIIIGRHQNTLEEINSSYVEANHIQVVRRLSGGGAVYHDLGNLNFSFITPYQPENFVNFKLFTEPVVRSLNGMGVKAELNGRNDIVVEERKISGNAQYIAQRRMVSHGTLLFNSDLSCVSEALKVKPGKIVSKGIKSVRSRVANISEFLSQPMEIEDFRARLLEDIFAGAVGARQYPLEETDWQAVRALADERYRTWEWNYGRSPDFNVQQTQRFPSGEIDARLEVHQGVIQTVRFYGDYFAEVEQDELNHKLVGLRYDRQEIARALQGVSIERYFSGVDLPAFIEFLCP
ncbi:MAG: lipoate--protein ligase [Chloroflexi bacterium]|nr:lipoate--protein ligase [Anaerolineaceae bacterium]NMB90383.1 lipoate--protein ligase [Chloroflexota bacterium]